MAPQPTTAGIITDETSGERHIPASVRADGSTRKAIKIRPGYKPPEDVEIYRNRTAESFRNRYKGGVIGAEAVSDNTKPDTQAAPAASPASAAANKNAKRREARKKAAAAATDKDDGAPASGDSTAAAAAATPATPAPAPVDPAVEREKKARGLKKKLKQAKDLKSKRDGGEALLPEQIAKVIRINELARELEALGFDSEDEPKTGAAETGDKEEKADKNEKADKAV